MSNISAKVRVAKAAERRFGRLSSAQLQELDVPRSTVAAWLKDGYLHRELPHVYAVGHRAQTVESDLASALLYAGPGGMLSHATAAWWLGLIEDKPRTIHVSTPKRRRSLKGVRVHDRRQHERIVHRDLPTSTIAQTLVDLAATAPRRTLRHALANAEYRKILDLPAVEAVLKRGSRGSSKLRQALEQHQPSLALTKSRLERMLIGICEQERLPLPEINVCVAGWEVDALWPADRLAVELDGYGNHHTPAQLRRDRRKEMALRQAGLTPVRYSEDQLKQKTQVARELRELTSPSGPTS